MRKRKGRIKKRKYHCTNGPWRGHALWLANGDNTLPIVLGDKRGFYRSGQWVPLCEQ